MKRHVIAIALSSVLATLCLNGPASAQTGPGAPGGQPGPGTPTVTPGKLPEQELEALIKKMDPAYQVRPGKDNKGKIYNLKLALDGWNYTLQIESFDNEIWINAELSGVISAPQNLPAGAMAELLKTNFNIGPTHFAFCPMTDNSGFKLFLSRLLSRQTTSAQFVADLDYFLKTVKDTYPTWSQIK